MSSTLRITAQFQAAQFSLDADFVNILKDAILCFILERDSTIAEFSASLLAYLFTDAIKSYTIPVFLAVVAAKQIQTL